MKHALVTTRSREKLLLNPKFKPKPIIWNNAGLYGLISLAQVENALRMVHSYTARETKNNPPSVFIHWDEVEIISKVSAERLLDAI